MSCRHRPGDPSCTSGNSPADLYKKGVELVTRWGPKVGMAPPTPDSEQYRVLDALEVGSALVMKVQYPSCEKCSYEGTKVLVFLNTSSIDALKWTRLDPHFGDPSETRGPHESPSPAARFPASKEGWEDALTYAKRKGKM